ncbi:peptidase domain-containing ABC transporter [Caulobacter sp. UNC358MFTsu5.1]|uniref:peptidase domain-containing ABC transporter n=1 Tax=Caulobacter sp. UNC358MFTsu5.1 TaxID=1449049 RepID=UPI0004A7187A|nr:peptidase domain-containing ABC transporter [Caulobacter sp. UNC358MFTsu5.1]
MIDLLDALNFERRRKLPVVLASEGAECGLACMAMIAAYHGHEIDLNGLRQRFSISLAGATLRNLMSLADQLAFESRPLRIGVDALAKVRTPAILHWDLNHFVVLKAVERDRVVIHDPARGVRTLSREDVSNHFTGVVLEVVPKADFQKTEARVDVRISSLWSRQRGFVPAFVQILSLSLALQIVAFAGPFQIQLVVDEAIGRMDENLLTVLALGFGGLILLQLGMTALRSWMLQVFGSMLTYQMVGNLVHHLLRLPSNFFEKRHVGDILSRLGSTSPIQDALTRGLIASVIDGVMALLAAVILFLYSPLLAGVVCASILLMLILAAVFYPFLRSRTEEQLIASAKERSHLMETVRAAVTIKLMGREIEREAAWRNRYASTINTSVSVAKFNILLGFLQNSVMAIQFVLVVFFGARLIIDGAGLSVGMLLAFLSFRQTFTDRCFSLINQGMEFTLLGLHLQRLGDIVGAAPETTGPAVLGARVAGGIEARDLSFRYASADPLVLREVSFDIAPGEFVALVGPSGGGKTTTLKLLLGLQSPTGGEVLLDGQPATPEYVRAWRASVGVVAQDDRLLSGTIADNIAFFDPDLDMARVIEAAEAACIHADVVRMPMQYLSLVGDMGSSLSGGQKQRILLARALYRQPAVLFLDEGTANLDEDTENAIGDLISALPITRVVVAHGPALVRRADRVLEVREGRVVESVRPDHHKRARVVR